MSTSELQQMLKGRDREFLHPGQPLLVIGNEQEDNGFRSRTPLLEGAEVDKQQLDPNEARERRLAMYTHRAVYSAPQLAMNLGLPDIGSGRSPDSPATEQPASPGSTGPEPSSAPSRAFLAALALLVLTAALGWRYRNRFQS